MKKYAVIVAGGEGNRAGGSVPKQFQMLGDVPMLWWSVRAFHEEDSSTEIILVLHPGFFDEWDILYSELPEKDRSIKVRLSCGGRSRAESVRNGLMSVPDAGDALVAVHDAARPLVTREIIARGWNAAIENGAAVPAEPMTDSIRLVSESGNVAVPRKDYVKVQTPQVFSASLIKNAYSRADITSMTDDASVAEAAGHRIALFDGSPYNMKVTDPLDIRIAELLLNTVS
ncbi:MULTISPECIES: IspD/TarI family cytidylyltransferase [Bacteroidales]|jgi:2-C-methyl-D-erythritol 4-phosphate cytidylyltransferase|uniref:IspD/TarI family cytidylyltransferase n=1 Tax=Bacteroidales TaxID=171549 RepID=UPI000E92B709|nr:MULTISPECIES: 2-C-methyl-D-erythritol 4-phosphate cytidylyltransferase [Bacteroidales]MCI9030285.1 2-C-methyl-D-erythritol 4-phosphate cytidylyltransferase [Muribaculaceae bacterium]ROS82692.1 2-C-methyl-D-erythritol 4-phosphate cytidylyltransferase [Muribaculaceae bacterium Isolate-036 (Harlan)]RXE66755.1 2-C-methyl-D-erythritol 4-phosphate cytidylyltransferase [Muribaculaceae bacterium Isolate-001 (NCI)]HBY16111.1 2-C-methyl-D-erythritol 4-phosphate cytidylyltransferase [Porphyromonadaceae